MNEMGSPESASLMGKPRWWMSPRLLVLVALVPAAVLLAILAWAITNPASGSSGGTNTNFSTLDLEGQEAPDFSLEALDGTMMQLSNLRGKPAMLDFWGSWCSSCRQEAPHLAQLYEEYRHLGVEFLGVVIWDVEDEANRYIEEFDITYVNALDHKGTVAIDYGVVATPEKFFINREGKIVRKFVGPASPELLRQQLDELLES